MKLKSSARINDECMELQKNKSAKKPAGPKRARKNKGSDLFIEFLSISTVNCHLSPVILEYFCSRGNCKGCPFLEPESQQLYRDYVLADNRDLEELHKLGQKLGCVCVLFNRPWCFSTVNCPYSPLIF